MPYTANSDWTTSIESKTADRNVRFVAVFPNDFNAVLDYCVSSVKIEDACVVGNSINFGGTCSVKANITFLSVNSWDLYLLADGNSFYLNIFSNDVVGATSPLLYINGVKIVQRHSDDSCDVTIEAFDGFSKTEKEYTPTAGLTPLTIRNIISDIGTQCGIAVGTTTWSNAITVPAIKSGLTYRQQIGYLAGLQGGFAKFSWELDSTLKLAWFSSTTKTITADEQSLDGLAIQSDSQTVIKILETGTKDAIITKPNTTLVGRAIKHENPYATDTIATAVYSSRISADSGVTPKIQFTPLTVRWRGNPEIVAGDIVKVKDASDNDLTCYIMKKTLEFDGGLSETYECFGESEQSVNFSPSPTDQKIQGVYTKLEAAIQNATNVINQTTGGAFKIRDTDNDGIADGWLITETSDGTLTSTTKCIVANYNGIGFSSDGGETMVTAILTDGSINASFITAGTLSTQVLNFDDIVSGINDTGEGIAISGSKILGLNSALDDLTADVGTATSKADAVDTKIAGWAHELDTTFIDGAKIYTGSIVASSLTVGDFTNYCRVNERSYAEWKFTTDTVGGETCQKINYNDWDEEIYAGLHYVYRIGEWMKYIPKTSYSVSGKMASTFNAPIGHASVGVVFVVRLKSYQGYNYYKEYKYGTAPFMLTTFVSYALTDVGGETFLDDDFDNLKANSADAIEAIAPCLLFCGHGEDYNQATSGITWIKDLTIRATSADAGAITAGILKSQDGKSFFNLNTSLVQTENIKILGGQIKIGDEDYYTEIKNSSIVQCDATSGGIIGGIVPLYSSGEQFQSVYCNSAVSEGVSINYKNSSGSFPAIAVFKPDEIILFKDISSDTGTVSITDPVDIVGKVEIVDLGGITSIGSTYCMLYNLYGTSGVNISNQESGGGFSSAADFTPSRVDIYHNTYVAGNIYSNGVQVTSIEEAKENIGDIDSALPLLRQSKIYKYKYKDTAKSGTKRSGKGQSDTEKDKANSIGFVIGRETPEEVISEDGEHVDIYNMVSVLWKATQEILTRLETLESERGKS